MPDSALTRTSDSGDFRAWPHLDRVPFHQNYHRNIKNNWAGPSLTLCFKEKQRPHFAYSPIKATEESYTWMIRLKKEKSSRHPNRKTPSRATCAPLHPNTIINEDPPDIHPVLFESLDAAMIRSAALKTSGSAGPSGLDSLAWRRLCTAFKSASLDLCWSLASTGKRLS